MQFNIDLSTYTVEIMDPEGVIENEIAQGLSQRQIAATYALAMRKPNCRETVDWARINKAILARWPKGLERIKKLAWTGRVFE